MNFLNYSNKLIFREKQCRETKLKLARIQADFLDQAKMKI